MRALTGSNNIKYNVHIMHVTFVNNKEKLGSFKNSVIAIGNSER